MDKKFEPFLAHSEITDFIYIIDKNDKYEVTEQCIKAMKATNRIPRWIPVSERLPKANEYIGDVARYYLIQNEYGDMLVARYDGKGWKQIYHHYEYLEDEVIAWMPLPEGYKAEMRIRDEKVKYI